MDRSDLHELKYELEKEVMVCDEALRGMASVLPFGRYGFSGRDDICMLHEVVRQGLARLSEAARRALLDVSEKVNLNDRLEARPVPEDVYDALKQLEKAFPAGEYRGLDADQHLALNRILDIAGEVRKDGGIEWTRGASPRPE